MHAPVCAYYFKFQFHVFVHFTVQLSTYVIAFCFCVVVSAQTYIRVYLVLVVVASRTCNASLWASTSTYTVHTQPSHIISVDTLRRWVEVGINTACDGRAGEVYMQNSPGKVSSLEQCRKSCQDSAVCQSITYFRSGWCSHFSTPCTYTKINNKAVALRLNKQSEITPTGDTFGDSWSVWKSAVHDGGMKSQHVSLRVPAHLTFPCP